MPYIIDTNVAFNPAKAPRKSKVMELPFAQLQVGQSFHIAATSKDEITKLSAWCQLAAKKLTTATAAPRFRLRTVDDSDPRGPGVRIWRIEDKGTSLDALFQAKGAGQPKGSTPAKGQKVSASEPVKPARKAKANPKAVAAEPRSFSRRQARKGEAHAN